MELLKAVLFGIVEGVTEWLPISSTGHLILLNEFITLNVSDAFRSMFDVVIQLGAILAVIASRIAAAVKKLRPKLLFMLTAPRIYTQRPRRFSGSTGR